MVEDDPVTEARLERRIGLRLGDVIVGGNGKPVRRLADLTQELERVGVGKKVPLAVQREGRETSVEVDVMDIGRRG